MIRYFEHKKALSISKEGFIYSENLCISRFLTSYRLPRLF